MNPPDFQGLEKKPRPPHWKRHVVRQMVGWSLIVIGIIDLPLPGPGWLIIGMGAIVLAPYVKIFHRFVEWLKRKFPSLRAPLERFESKHLHDHDQPTS